MPYEASLFSLVLRSSLTWLRSLQVSTEYHLCNLNDVHHRSPGKSFLQPLVTLRGLIGSDRWETKDEALEVMGDGYSSSVHVKSGSSTPVVTDRATFGGIENSVDTSWSFQYATYPFLHGPEDAIVFLGQCYLLGEVRFFLVRLFGFG